MDEDTRRLLHEIGGALDAIVVALQTETEAPSPGYGTLEAVRRVNRVRERLHVAGGPITPLNPAAGSASSAP